MEVNFWQIVLDELEYQGKTRKWLAAEANFDVSTIGSGLKRNGLPLVDLALRIASALKVPVEYLVTGNDSNTKKQIETDSLQRTIKEMLSIPGEHLDPIKQIIHNTAELFKEINTKIII